jgi:hypothetical protein
MIDAANIMHHATERSLLSKRLTADFKHGFHGCELAWLWTATRY